MVKYAIRSSNAGRPVGGGAQDKLEVSTVKFIASCVKFIVEFPTKAGFMWGTICEVRKRFAPLKRRLSSSS